MIKRLFNDKKFIFIFTFLVEIVLYYYFEYLFIGGQYIIPDIGIPPIFGLIFGPVGALGQALASFAFECYEGLDIIASLIDGGIMFFISILTYKLWYTIFKKRVIETPKFDSAYNLLKFFTIILIVSIVYWTFINIALEAYPRFNVIYPIPAQYNVLSYFLNMFNFSIIYGLLFISIFNIMGIPMQMPKRWPNFFNIPYKYFVLVFSILISYLIISIILNLNYDLLENCFLITFALGAILFCFNKFDAKIKAEKKNYSIIEQIILIFLVLLIITAILLILVTWDFVRVAFFETPDIYNLLIMIIISLATLLFLIISLIYIFFIERDVTNPIYDLIDVLTEYGKNKEINEEQRSKISKYLKSNDDISILVESFNSLNKNIQDNLSQIKNAAAKKERIETELNVASNIQSHMLKTDFEEFSKDKPFEIYGLMRSAREVGGDFYDYFQIDEDNVGFVIGDVSTKGVPATLFMIKTMYLIRNHAKFKKNPKEVFETVNDLSCQRNDEELFITAWFGKLNLKNGKLIFVNAGHEQPLISNSIQENDFGDISQNGSETFEYLNIPSNFVLGGFEGISYRQNELILNSGDTIFLYTDGITEANDEYKGFYGKNRLKETINKYKNQSLKDIIEIIKNDVYEFCGEDQFDDMTMLIIRYNGNENNSSENNGSEIADFANDSSENNGSEIADFANDSSVNKGCENNG